VTPELRMSALGPLLPFGVRFLRRAERGKGAPGRAAARDARRSPQVATALRCSVAWPCRPTRFAHFVRCAQTNGGKSDHDARCARGPRALRFSAPCHARPSPPGHTFAQWRWVRASSSVVAARQAVSGLRPVGGGEQRRSGVGARSAPRDLTRRRLSERSERSERSELGDATPGRAAQCSRSEAETATVWPQPRHRLPRRASHPPESRRRRTAATGRKQTFIPQRFVHRGSRESRWSN